MTRAPRSGTRTLLRLFVGLLALALVSALALGFLEATTYDARAWRADFKQLKRELAQRYANLDWMVGHRHVDLKALDAETSDAIDNAHSGILAARALKRFVTAFADPHLHVVDRDPGETAPTPSEPSIASCEDDGYEARDVAFRFPFSDLAGWTALRAGHFPTGLAGDLGVLRIASFAEEHYLDICKGVFRRRFTSRDLQLLVRTKLQQELADALTELKARGAQRLLIDVSHNGGGSEWAVEAVALLTDRALTRPASRLAAPACDRSGIWRGETVCPVLARPGEPANLTGKGVWTGPLFVLADGGTASASEDFVVWLQQNRVAKIIGARTLGAGCGYVDGGGRIRLKTAPFDVMAPNCARFLADGTNEIEGIAPDVTIPMEAGVPDRAAALAAVLARF